MYEQFFGLREKPFSLTPDPDFLFINKHFRGALDNVLYGIKRQEGFTTIVGDVGTGKTTLCWTLLGRLDGKYRTALILNPLLNEEDMLKAILQDFGVRPRKCGSSEPGQVEGPYDPGWMHGLSRKELIDELNYYLLAGSEQDMFHILIVDEAQNLSLPVLEQLRVLSNLETAKKKLLQIIFVGQLEFAQRLSLPQLRQLDQRITIRYSLKPLSKKDMMQYIERRLLVAGSKGGISFTPGALRRIYAYSKGYPRLINVICDRALLAGYSERSRVITSQMVGKAARGIRRKEKGTRRRIFSAWRLVAPLAALLALTLLAVLCYWIWRGFLPYRSEILPPADSVLAAVKQPSESQAAEGDQLRDSDLRVATVDLRAQKTDQSLVSDSPVGIYRVSGGSRTSAKEDETPLGPTVADPPRENGSISDGNPAPSGAGIPLKEFAGKYLLQVHSLRTRMQADAALVDLKRAGYPAFYRIERVPPGVSWYVVYAGPYDSVEHAHALADNLKQHNSISPIVRHY